MRIVCTGATGFLGSWIVRALEKEHELILLTRPETNPWRISSIRNIDIRKLEVAQWPGVIKKIGPDALILNDWWGVGNQFRNDERQFNNLERFKLNVNAALEANIQKVIGVGSQAEFGPVSGYISESQLNKPTTRYGEAKVAAHEFLAERVKNYVWFRVFSTYGAMDNSDWLIPMIFNKLQADERVPLTRGEQIWSYLHAYDLSQAMRKVINTDIKGEVNVGNPQTLTIRDAALAAADYFGKRELLDFGHIPYRDDQVMELRPLTQKLSSAGWKPSVTFEAGIKHTYDWMMGLNSARKFNNYEMTLVGNPI